MTGDDLWLISPLSRGPGRRPSPRRASRSSPLAEAPSRREFHTWWDLGCTGLLLVTIVLLPLTLAFDSVREALQSFTITAHDGAKFLLDETSGGRRLDAPRGARALEYTPPARWTSSSSGTSPKIS